MSSAVLHQHHWNYEYCRNNIRNFQTPKFLLVADLAAISANCIDGMTKCSKSAKVPISCRKLDK